jgi:hypothetical protein
MDKTITKIIIDEAYAEPSLRGETSTFLHFGPYHLKEVIFGIQKHQKREAIFCKLPNAKKFYQLFFNKSMGSYGKNGVQKIGVHFPRKPGKPHCLFSLGIEEIIQIHKELESVILIKDWQKYMENETRV